MKEKRNFSSAPADVTIHNLIDFIWDNGIGNRLSEHGDPVPWTDETLEAAFETHGYAVDRRTFQNWHSRATLPRRDNLAALARVIAEDETSRRQWAETLLAARTSAERKRRASQEPPASDDRSDRSGRPLLAAGFVAIIVMLTGTIALLYSRAATRDASGSQDTAPREPQVLNLAFCDSTKFSRANLTCTESQSIFPAATEIVYVSFDFANVPDGHPFERRWYRQGREFLRKDGFNDDVWEGWTWLSNPSLIGPGRYELRIIVDDHVSSGRFTVGDTPN